MWRINRPSISYHPDRGEYDSKEALSLLARDIEYIDIGLTVQRIWYSRVTNQLFFGDAQITMTDEEAISLFEKLVFSPLQNGIVIPIEVFVRTPKLFYILLEAKNLLFNESDVEVYGLSRESEMQIRMAS